MAKVKPRESLHKKIERLERENHELRKLNEAVIADNRRQGAELIKMNDNIDTDIKKSSVYQAIERELETVKMKNSLLASENQRLRQKNDDLIDMLNQSKGPESTKNPMGAGRKANDAKQQAKHAQFAVLLAENKTMREIMQIMGISQRTYFRYLSYVKNN